MMFSRCFALPVARIAFLALALVPALPSAAHAKLRFCNKTETPIEAAYGHRDQSNDGDVWVSEGWWRIEPDQCSVVNDEQLTQRFYYYYATALTMPSADKKPFVWQGKYQFCVDNKAFRIEGDGDCEGRGYRMKQFQQIDIGPNARTYDLNFKDGG